jgi:diguanylate cyclase (GGDEF)-like protein
MEPAAGSGFLARLRATPLHDLSHRLERLLVSVEDLTEHAVEVELARRNASQTRALLDELDLAVVVHDADGRVREVNLGAHRLFGEDATDLIGHRGLPAWWRAEHVDHRPLVDGEHPAERVLAEGLGGAEAVIGVHRGPGLDADAPPRWFLVRARPLFEAAGHQRSGAAVTYTDVSGLQQQVHAAVAEHRIDVDTFDSLPVPAYQTGRDLAPARVSAALRRLLRVDGPSPAQPGGSEGPGDDTLIDLTSDPPVALPRRGPRAAPPRSDPGSGAAPDPAAREPAGPERTDGPDGPGGAGDEQPQPAGFADLFTLAHRNDRRTLADALAEAATQRLPVRLHHRLAPEHGGGWVDHQINPLVLDGEVQGYLGVIIPVPEWVAEGDRTRRLVRLVETANELVGEFELETDRVTYLNPRAVEVFEVDGRRLDQLRLTDLYDGTEDAFRQQIWPQLVATGQWEGELPMRTAAGRTLHVQQWITAERGPDGRIVRLVAAGHDVTDRSEREKELAVKASHDALTGLPNRTQLLERLDAALGRARRAGRLVGLAFLDLDRFKVVNDRFGHDGGDRLLVQVAHRLTSVLRPADLVARLGGDEFVVLCDGVEDKSHALTVANRVAHAIGTRPYTIDGASIRVTASVGLALSLGTEHPEALLRDADAALYRAKHGGRARIELFDETMRSRANNRVALAEELRVSLAADAIAVHYQPSIDLRTGNVRAVEALARWEHPSRGLLQPQEFIDVAESTGLLAELGEQVLREAAKRARAWQHRFGPLAPAIHVNLSSRQIIDSELLDTVQAVLSATGLQPSLLCLELTESVLLEDSDRAIATVRELTGLGVRLAIDDFGTGYSSLSYLSRLPVDVVKIDKSFVEVLEPSRPQASVVAGAIISLAHALGLSAIAEGVTTISQLAELHRLGCDAAQGFYFSEPLTAGAIDDYLASRLPRATEPPTTPVPVASQPGGARRSDAGPT